MEHLNIKKVLGVLFKFREFTATPMFRGSMFQCSSNVPPNVPLQSLDIIEVIA